MKYYSYIKYIIIIVFFVFLLFLFFRQNRSLDDSFVKNKIPRSTPFEKKYVKDIRFNKVIIIGDSRMQRLRDRKQSIDIPLNFIFIAKGGAKIDWLEETACDDLYYYLDNADKQYKYHVVVNMGVNDLEDNSSYDVFSKKYYKIFTRLMNKYPNVTFYFMSVNPIIEKVLNKWQPWSFRTDKKIELFNDSLNNKIMYDNYDNYYYCDSYSNIDFSIPDGIHYDKVTDQKIVNYIVNNCLRY